MAPPAGTSSMLRSRRRDATLKPNRSLDRNASRGMLYENEELRLRTININAEVEKGQNYIKKLRRENEQLKREIWNLREEYERLENYVKSREQSEDEEEDDDDRGGGGQLVSEEGTPTDIAVVTLETVVEEDDEEQSAQGQDRSLEPVDNGENGENDESQRDPEIPDVGVDNYANNNNNNNNCNVIASTANPRRDVVVCTTPIASSGGLEGQTVTSAVIVTADVLATDVGCGGDRYDSGCLQQQQQQQQQHWDDRIAVDRTGDGRDLLVVDDGQVQVPDPLQGQPHLDAAVLQPHTACFDTGNNRQLHDLMVDEVIEAAQVAELRDKLRTVCLTDDRCYMTFANAECLERALHTGFRIRDVPVLLMDTGAGAVILSLTGVPDSVSDKDVLKCLKKYGTIIGGVDRKTARGGTTGGERYVRVRPTLGAPRYLWFGSDKVIVRQLTEHETGTMNSIARRKSFRSQIKLNLKMADTSPSSSAACDESCKENSGVGIPVNGSVRTSTTMVTAVSAQHGFRFPTDSKTAIGPPTAESKAAAAASLGSNKSTGSPKRSKPTPIDRDGGPPTAAVLPSGPAESPLRGRRRASLMGFRRETIKHRGGSVSRVDGGGEDADSDTSTICRRKLSITGREGTEKVPWCGCWGNGCL